MEFTENRLCTYPFSTLKRAMAKAVFSVIIWMSKEIKRQKW